MQDLPACVSFSPRSTEAQKQWLQRTRIPLASVLFGPSDAPHFHDCSLATLPLMDPECLTASESTLRSVAGLEAVGATTEQFAAFCQRFAALQSLKLNLPPRRQAETALRSLPHSLRHLSTTTSLSSFQVLSLSCAQCPMSAAYSFRRCRASRCQDPDTWAFAGGQLLVVCLPAPARSLYAARPVSYAPAVRFEHSATGAQELRRAAGCRTSAAWSPSTSCRPLGIWRLT